MSAKLHLIALGANLPSAAGPPRATLEAALALLEVRGLAVVARSRWRRTPAYPPGAGPDYVNGAAALTGLAGPEAALEALHAVERALGRDRRRRWEARVCDLDLLASGDAVLPDRETAEAWMRLAPSEASGRTPPRLILPHPRLHERGFVLAPLADVAPGWIHPLLGLSVREMLMRLPPEALAGVEPL